MGLVAYWAGTVVIAVGGWQTHLVRARRIRVGNKSNTAAMEKRDEKKRERERANQLKRDTKKEKENLGGVGGGSVSAISTGISETVGGATAGGMKLLGIRRKGSGEDPNLTGGPSSGGMSESVPMGRVGAESARETKAVHASLNMRRKFFHALAVLMFVPGIAIDVSCSLCTQCLDSMLTIFFLCSPLSRLSLSASLSPCSLSLNTLVSLHFTQSEALFTSSLRSLSIRKIVDQSF